MKSKSPHARAPDKLLPATKWRAVAQIRGPEDPMRLMGPGSAAQRDRTMRSLSSGRLKAGPVGIAGRTPHRVRDTTLAKAVIWPSSLIFSYAIALRLRG